MILSGAIKQPTIRLANCNMMDYEGMMTFIICFIIFFYGEADAVTLKKKRRRRRNSNRELCFVRNVGAALFFLIFASASSEKGVGVGGGGIFKLLLNS